MLSIVRSWCRHTKANRKYIGKKAVQWTTGFIAAFQVIGFLFDFGNVLPEKLTMWKKLLMSGMAVGGLWLVSYLVAGLWTFNKSRVIVMKTKNGHHVYVEYGDLFVGNGEKRTIVVTANRCFDTEVNDILITSNSIHGLAIKKIGEDGICEVELNKRLQSDLKRRNVNPCCILNSKDKRMGNLKRYPVGTIAEYKKDQNSRETYFFVGMSAFNSDLHPETTDMEYVQTMQLLIEYCGQRSQRFPIYMPIIGTNGRDNGKTEQELLEYMVSTLCFNEHLIDTDIHIVVHKERRDDISIYHL